MTKRKCKKCGHNQELSHTNRVKWACSDCGFRNKLKAIALASILILTISSMSLAYAEIETVSVPFPPPYETDCSYSVGEYLIFMCTWRSEAIPDDVKAEMANLDNKTDILPPNEIEAGKDRILLDWLYAPDMEIEPEPEPPKPTVEEILKDRLPVGIKEAVDKLGECEYGLEGWAAFQQRSSYEVPDQFIWIHGQVRNDVIVKDLNMAFEACRIQRDYPLSAMYENKILADILGLDRFGREQTHTFNQTTDFERYYYEPLTQDDFDEAEQRAQDFKCSEAGIALGHCVLDDYIGINRGNPNPIVKNIFDYNQYINFKAGQIQTQSDYEETIADAREAQCVVHYPIYKHRQGREGGSELPVWLEHCESFEEEFARIGYACYLGKVQTLCRDMPIRERLE